MEVFLPVFYYLLKFVSMNSIENIQLRAKRLLLQFKDVLLRIRGAQTLYKVYGTERPSGSFNGTSLICNNALLAPNRRYDLGAKTLQYSNMNAISS